MTTTKLRHEDRILVRDGRRHHRRTYSRTELRLGFAVFAVLLLVILWVAWKGAHPDPELFASDVDLLPSSTTIADRGPLPEGLAIEGWAEGTVDRFDASNLYEKINGREGFYKSRGFRSLTFVSLVLTAEPTTAVDIELYDLGEAANALSAYTAEKSSEGESAAISNGMGHFDRNALFLTRGSYYVRAIGSNESEAVRAQLERLRTVFEAGLEGEELPGPYAIFTVGLGMAAGAVTYHPENAFSFGFAREVYSALLDDGETEVFVVQAADSDDAREQRARYTRGFLDYGRPVGESMEVEWVADRFLGSVAGTQARGPWLFGVRGAPDLASAEAALARLREVIPEPDEAYGD